MRGEKVSRKSGPVDQRTAYERGKEFIAGAPAELDAKRHNVSLGTLRRDAIFARLVERLEAVHPGAADALLSGAVRARRDLSPLFISDDYVADVAKIVAERRAGSVEEALTMVAPHLNVRLPEERWVALRSTIASGDRRAVQIQASRLELLEDLVEETYKLLARPSYEVSVAHALQSVEMVRSWVRETQEARKRGAKAAGVKEGKRCA